MNPSSTPAAAEPSLADLLKELRDETTTLVRQEVALAKQEVSEKTSKIGRNAGYLIAGGLVAYAGAVVLVGAMAVIVYGLLVAAGVAHMTAGWVAPLLVGIVVTVIGYALVKKATSTFSEMSLAPEKTAESLRENKEWIKEKVTT